MLFPLFSISPIFFWWKFKICNFLLYYVRSQAFSNNSWYRLPRIGTKVIFKINKYPTLQSPCIRKVFAIGCIILTNKRITMRTQLANCKFVKLLLNTDVVLLRSKHFFLLVINFSTDSPRFLKVLDFLNLYTQSGFKMMTKRHLPLVL